MLPRRRKTGDHVLLKLKGDNSPPIRTSGAPTHAHGGGGADALVTVVVEVGPYPKVSLSKTKYNYKPLRLDPLLRRLQALGAEHNELSSSIGALDSGKGSSSSSVGDIDGVLASGDRFLLRRVFLPKNMAGILRIFVDNDVVIDINYIEADVGGPRLIEHIVGQVDREVRMTRSNLVRANRASVKKPTTFTYSRSDIDEDGTPAGYGKKTKLPTKVSI